MDLKILDGKGKELGVLTSTLNAFVAEERNGIFELDLEHLVNKAGYEYLVRGNIIVCNTSDTLKDQQFRIYRLSKEIAGRVKVSARHISFDLAKDVTEGLDIKNQSCEYVLNTLFRNSQFSTDYRGYSNIINAQDYKVGEENILRAIGGVKGSILDTFGTGAEILRDNKNIKVLNRRGRDNGVTIEYAKNLTGFNLTTDDSSLITRIKAFAKYTPEGGEETKVYSNPKYVDSPLINNYATPYIATIDFTDKFKDNEIPTSSRLKTLAEYYFIDTKCDIVKQNYKIDFIPLSKCVGYESLNDKISLCDEVTIINKMYNITTQAKVIKSKFNVLLDRLESLELGESKTTLGDVIGTGGAPQKGDKGDKGDKGEPGKDGEVGDFPNSLPAIPILHSKVYGFSNVELSWTFENKVYYSYELYSSREKNFTPNTFNLLFEGQASTFLNQLEPAETWYYKVCAVNTHGERTQFSNEVEVNTVKIEDLSDYVESAAIGDALIGELNLGRGWFGELRGNYIDAKQLSVTDGNGKRTLDIDSFGNVNLDAASLSIRSENVETSLNNQAEKISLVEQKTTSDAIINTVSTDFYKKNEVDITYAKKTELKQLDDSLNINITESINQAGGENLVKNSSFNSKDFSNWGKWGGVNDPVVWRGNIQSGHEWAVKIQATGLNQGIEQQVTGLIVGEKYTASCMMYSEGGIQGIMVRNSGVYNGNHLQAPQETWKMVKFDFVAEENTTWIHIGTVNDKCSDGVVWTTGIQVKRGEYQQWTPNPSEIYTANFKFDSDGMKGDFEDGTYIKMGRKGFEWYDSQSMNHAYHCLTKSGTFNVSAYGNGNWTKCKIQLPAYFKGKYFEPTCSLTGYQVGGFTIDTITATIESYNIEEAWFIIQVFCYTQQQGYLNNINVSWTVNA